MAGILQALLAFFPVGVPAAVVNGLPAAIAAGKSEVTTLLLEAGLSDTVAAGAADAVMVAAAAAAA